MVVGELEFPMIKSNALKLELRDDGCDETSSRDVFVESSVKCLD